MQIDPQAQALARDPVARAQHVVLARQRAIRIAPRIEKLPRGVALRQHEAQGGLGLLKLRLFRPLPAAALRAALAGVADVVVLDRNHSPGHGGVLHQELRAALYGIDRAPRIHGYLAGVGGVNVSPERIAAFVQRAQGNVPQPHSE